VDPYRCVPSTITSAIFTHLQGFNPPRCSFELLFNMLKVSKAPAISAKLASAPVFFPRLQALMLTQSQHQFASLAFSLNANLFVLCSLLMYPSLEATEFPLSCPWEHRPAKCHHWLAFLHSVKKLTDNLLQAHSQKTISLLIQMRSIPPVQVLCSTAVFPTPAEMLFSGRL